MHFPFCLCLSCTESMLWVICRHGNNVWGWMKGGMYTCVHVQNISKTKWSHSHSCKNTDAQRLTSNRTEDTSQWSFKYRNKSKKTNHRIQSICCGVILISPPLYTFQKSAWNFVWYSQLADKFRIESWARDVIKLLFKVHQKLNRI